MTAPHVQAVLSRLKNVQKHLEGEKWEACCPAHDDQRRSLGVSVGRVGQVLLYCQANCSLEAICSSLGITMRELYPPVDQPVASNRITKVYNYTDEKGNLLFQCCRWEPKNFTQRQPNGKGGWLNHIRGVRRVLYRLPDLVNTPMTETVFVVEGEKDADNLWLHGLAATTCPMGAGKWKKEYAEFLRNRPVVVLPDNDAPGRLHAQVVARDLEGVASSVRILELPGLPEKGDVSDWLMAGGTKEKLQDLLAQKGKGVNQFNPAGTSEEWGAYIPIGHIPSAAPFPLAVLPAGLQRFAREAAWAINCPVDFLAVPALAIAGGMIGNTRRLQITTTHAQSACLYTVVVGSPGSGKSPALNQVMTPLEEFEQIFRQQWYRDFEEWEKKDKEEKKKAPPLRRCFVDDSTTEKLTEILRDNPRGLVMVRDEMAALVSSFNQYRSGGKGADRQFYLKVWSHAYLNNDRKSNPNGTPVSVYKPFLSIAGGIQPSIVRLLRGKQEDNDGFLDRFLFSYPDPLPAVEEQWRDVSQDAVQGWSSLLRNLLDVPQRYDNLGRVSPRNLTLAPSGKAAWQSFTRSHAQEVNAEEFPEYLVGPWSKLRGYCARLALIIHGLREADGEYMTQVDGDSLKAAWSLVDYFKSHIKKVFYCIETDLVLPRVRRLTRWIVRENRSQFRRREVFKDIQSDAYFPTMEALDEPLDRLVKHNCLRVIDDENRRGSGRPASQTYLVHPDFIRDQLNELERRQPYPLDREFCRSEGSFAGNEDEGEILDDEGAEITSEQKLELDRQNSISSDPDDEKCVYFSEQGNDCAEDEAVFESELDDSAEELAQEPPSESLHLGTGRHNRRNRRNSLWDLIPDDIIPNFADSAGFADHLEEGSAEEGVF